VTHTRNGGWWLGTREKYTEHSTGGRNAGQTLGGHIRPQTGGDHIHRYCWENSHGRTKRQTVVDGRWRGWIVRFVQQQREALSGASRHNIRRKGAQARDVRTQTFHTTHRQGSASERASRGMRRALQHALEDSRRVHNKGTAGRVAVNGNRRCIALFNPLGPMASAMGAAAPLAHCTARGGSHSQQGWWGDRATEQHSPRQEGPST
jgi:hypothetical protein